MAARFARVLLVVRFHQRLLNHRVQFHRRHAGTRGGEPRFDRARRCCDDRHLLGIRRTVGETASAIGHVSTITRTDVGHDQVARLQDAIGGARQVIRRARTGLHHRIEGGPVRSSREHRAVSDQSEFSLGVRTAVSERVANRGHRRIGQRGGFAHQRHFGVALDRLDFGQHHRRFELQFAETGVQALLQVRGDIGGAGEADRAATMPRRKCLHLLRDFSQAAHLEGGHARRVVEALIRYEQHGVAVHGQQQDRVGDVRHAVEWTELGKVADVRATPAIAEGEQADQARLVECAADLGDAAQELVGRDAFRRDVCGAGVHCFVVSCAAACADAGCSRCRCL